MTKESEVALRSEIEKAERELAEIERQIYSTPVRGIVKHRLIQDRIDCREFLAGLRLALARG